jgi:hypothetical protein
MNKRAEPSLLRNVCLLISKTCFFGHGDENDPHCGSNFRGIVGHRACARAIDHAIGPKAETSCTTTGSATSGRGDEKTSNSMAVEKSAVLPDAGGANSAASTVQSGGKPMIVGSDCQPDSKPKG